MRDLSSACPPDFPFLLTRRVARYISRIRLPKVLVSAAIALLRIAIQRRGNFDLHDVAPIKAVSSTFVPALFAHADGDDFITPQHSKALQAAYAGDSNFISFEGDHNSQVTATARPTAPPPMTSPFLRLFRTFAASAVLLHISRNIPSHCTIP